MPERPCRIALYSHDTMGLGHMRRNILVAHALSRLQPAPSILMLFGAREAAAYPLPPGVEAVTLPAFSKDSAGAYRARSLDVSLNCLVRLRAGALQSILGSYAPDLLIVDKVARGAMGELEPALKLLRRRQGTRLVLGLRDLLDDAATVRREWVDDRTVAAIRSYYDAVWVYGDWRICDPVQEYGLPLDVARKVQHTGYLDPRCRWGAPTHEPASPPEGRYALCMVGGGQDGGAIALAFAAAARPAGCRGVIVTGPFLPAETRTRLEQHVARDPGLILHGFVPDPSRLIAGAARVVAMGGYNTVTELLAYAKPSLVIPRVRPRTEQLLRAERMAALGLFQVLLPDGLGPEPIAAWLAAPVRDGARAIETVDFGGIGRVTSLARGLLSAPAARVVSGIRSGGIEAHRVAV